MSEDNLTPQDRQNLFYKTLTWYFGEKTTPTGFYHKVGQIEQRLGELISTLNKADESSTKLTLALNNITKAGVWIAGIGLFVAIFNLLFEILKHFKVI